MISMHSFTSSQFPTAYPRGESILVTKALVSMPQSSPVSIIPCASCKLSSTFLLKLPRPNLTSNTRESGLSAIFFDMIDDICKGRHDTVLVTSRSAYIRLSAGHIDTLGDTIAPFNRLPSEPSVLLER